MMRRGTRSRAGSLLSALLPAVLAAVLVLSSAACNDSGDDGDGGTTTTRAVDHGGPDLGDVKDATTLVAALEKYTGPYRIDAEVDFAGPHTETTTFDGKNWNRVDDPGSPIDEFRWVSDGKTASCYQRNDDQWVTEGGSTDISERTLSSNFDNWTVFQFIDGTNERPLDEVVTFEVTADGWALVVKSPPDDYLTRVEFVVDGGKLTGTRQYMTDGSLRSTQKISFTDVPKVVPPDDVDDGIDVTC